MTGSYNNFFKIFDRHSKREIMLEASKEIAKPRTVLKARKVSIVFNCDQWSSIIFLYTFFHFRYTLAGKKRKMK